MKRLLRKRLWLLGPWLLAFVLHPLLASAQRYPVTVYTENDGLPSSIVEDVLQDPSGRLWFATRGGVSRYDGVEWTTYTTRHGLPTTYHNALDLDDGGRLWAVSWFVPFQVSSFTDGVWAALPPLPFDRLPTAVVTAFAVTGREARCLVAVATGPLELFGWNGETWRRWTTESGLRAPVNDLVGRAGEIYVDERGVVRLEGDTAPAPGRERRYTCRGDHRARHGG